MSEDMISFDESIKVLNSFITNLDVFFETGVMKKEHQPFVECYTIVYKLADQKDHAAELYGFHKSTMKNHLKDA